MGQPTIPPTPSGTTLKGKTAIITGGNAGLGYETARQYLLLGISRVILAVRSVPKGNQAANALLADSTVKSANAAAIVDVFELDLDDYESGLKFVAKVKKEVMELDILLCNGGMNIMQYKSSISGHEQVMQVNCYTNLLIALELLPLLKNTAQLRQQPSHLTIVGSATQKMSTLHKKSIPSNTSVLTYLDDKRQYSSMMRYPDSKLVVASYIQTLSTKISPSEVIVNDPCPGMVATGFNDNMPSWLRPLLSLYSKFAARDVGEGARALVFATAVAGPETHGKFLQHNKVDDGTVLIKDSVGNEFAARVWADTIEDLAKVDSDLMTYK